MIQVHWQFINYFTQSTPHRLLKAQYRIFGIMAVLMITVKQLLALELHIQFLHLLMARSSYKMWSRKSNVFVIVPEGMIDRYMLLSLP